MTVKGTLIATLAAGYLATAAPGVVHAEDKAPAKGEKAGCKGAGGCKGEKGEKAEKKKGDKAGCKGAGGCKGHEGEKKEEKKAEEKK